MLEKYVRAVFQSLLVDPIAKVLPLTPLLITILGCVLGLVASIAIGVGFVWGGLVLLLLSGYCDTLDGTIARLHSATSPFGAMLDIICDRLVEASILIGLYFVAPEERALVTLCMFASVLICVTSFLVVGIFSENSSDKSFYYSPGLIERPEAFLFFILMILFPSFFVLLGWLFTLLVFLTAGIRIYQFEFINCRS